jgi:serine protease Do
MRKRGAIAASLVLACASVLVAAVGSTGEQKRTHEDVDTLKASPQTDEEPMRSLHEIARWAGGETRIGVAVRDLDAEQGQTLTGAVVEDVQGDSPAAKAGMKTGDVVVEFDGEKVRSARHLTRLVQETRPERTVRAAVMREGKRIDLQVTPTARSTALLQRDMSRESRRRTPGSRTDGRPFTFEMPRDFHFQLPDGDESTFEFFTNPQDRGRLGIGIQEVTPQLAEFFGTKGGVLVTSVRDDSPAAKAGLKAGDVITAIDDQPVDTPSELIRAVARADGGSSIRIAYTRDKKAVSTTATLSGDRSRRPARPA